MHKYYIKTKKNIYKKGGATNVIPLHMIGTSGSFLLETVQSYLYEYTYINVIKMIEGRKTTGQLKA